jgi:hypothetical protein
MSTAQRPAPALAGVAAMPRPGAGRPGVTNRAAPSAQRAGRVATIRAPRSPATAPAPLTR